MNSSQNQPVTILLLEADDDARQPLVDNLRKHGFRVIVTVSPQDAQEWVKYDQNPPNIILINQVQLSVAAYLEVGRSLRQQLQQPNYTAIVVLAERYGDDLAGQNIQVEGNTYVSYLEDAQQLFTLLEQLSSGG